MATMEDLISSLSGGMHVSQDGYDIKALQEYLYQTMHMPALPAAGPSNAAGGYRGGVGPSSRSASVTRKPTSLPSTYSYSDSGMFPSPLPSAAFNPYPDESSHQLHVALPTPSHGPRPGMLGRTSSYGFGGGNSAPASPAANFHAFEADAFAPVWQEQLQRQAQISQDPWARIRGQQSTAFPQQTNSFSSGSQWNAAPGLGQHQSAFGGFQYNQQPTHQQSQLQFQHQHPSPPVEANEEMDEDMIDAEMDEEEEEERVERVMGLSGMEVQDGSVSASANGGADAWQRGRRKM